MVTFFFFVFFRLCFLFIVSQELGYRVSRPFEYLLVHLTRTRRCHSANKTGVALQLDNNNNSISNSVISYCLSGIMIAMHTQTAAGTSRRRASTVRFIDCYFDGGPLYVDEVSGALFLFPLGNHPRAATPRWC